MTTPPPGKDPVRRQAARELAGLALILLGVLGGLTVLTVVDVRLALGALCTASVVAGVALTMSKE